MEPRERVPGIRERGEACEIREKKRCVRDNVDSGQVIVMVPAAQSGTLVEGEHAVKREIDDVSRCHDAAFAVHSLATENLDGDDDKENAGQRRVLGEPKPLRDNRETDKISPLQQQTRANRSPRHESVGKIPRPANAFMLFANEWRKKLAAENPRESNKDISVRLGIFWKNMSTELKEKYFALAREVDAEHKRKYPDYVYNPKEARLRKAMREQSREQSRERSRRSILQSAIAIANARGAPIAAVSASVAGGFLNQHHRFDCVSATPSVPMPGPGMSAHRTEPPWYQQTAHRPKPVHSPRIGDWYGGMDSDPIERLQAMGAMHHQQQQQQQRGLDKPPPVVKEQRNQECAAAAFSSNGHSPDFAAAERELRRQETAADYADFVDGQKWHPYQNSVGSHPHPRTSHPSPQMGGILHPNANAHGHAAHGPWGQFCHGVLPHVPTVTHSAATIRGPRHAVFLRDRPPTRHCAFPEDASRMGYAPSKLDVDGIRASYPSPEHQMPRLLESAMDSVVDSTAAMSRRDEDDGTRWGGANNVAADVSSLDEFVPTSMPQEGAVAREKERESWRSNERFEPKKKPVSRQPLPGFHQAFGSTEIGKFSRSEFFVNMVGENGGSGGGNGDGGGNVGDADDGDVSRERPPLLEAAAAAAAATAAAAAAAAAAAVAATTNAGRTFDAADQAFAVGDGASYRGQRTTTPSWHSPHLIPEAYRLTTPLLFPFPPASRNVLGVNVVHGIVEDSRLVSHVLPNECCWFARTGRAITRIPDDLVMTGALMDYSYRASEREWIRRKAMVAHVPIGYPAMLGNSRGVNYERIIGDRAQRNYVIVDETGDHDVGRERGSETVNLKIEREQNAIVDTNVHESVERQN